MKVNKMSRINKIYRVIAYIILIAVLGFIVWFALINYNIIDNPYEEKIEFITLSQKEVRLKRKNTYQISATPVPMVVRNSVVTFKSSDPKVATVNELSGFITALSNGTTTITATLKSDKSISADCLVIVSDNDIMINKIDLNTKSINVQVDGTYPISYRLLPKEATLYSIAYYSSDETVASVDEYGKVTGNKEGRAIITVTDKITGIKGTINVTVYDKNTAPTNNKDEKNVKEPKSISVSPKIISVNTGASRKIDVKITPSDANKNVTWRSLDTDIATVSSDGKVVGKRSGMTKVIATTVNGLEDYVDVTVSDNVVGVEKLIVEPSIMTLNVGEKKEFKYTISPTNATNQGVMIESTDDNIISINDNYVIGNAPGSAEVIITAVDGEYKATISVTVKNVQNVVKETGLTLSTNKVNIIIGGSYEVTATVTPSKATYKEVTWKSSNTNVATVDNGLIYGVGAGKAEITATTKNGIKKTVVVNVSKIDIKEVTLDKSDEKIKVGETLSLVKTIVPDSASSQSVSWDSSNTNVATVDNNGLVRGKNVGKAIITVRTNNGKTASCMVEVTK